MKQQQQQPNHDYLAKPSDQTAADRSLVYLLWPLTPTSGTGEMVTEFGTFEASQARAILEAAFET